LAFGLSIRIGLPAQVSAGQHQEEGGILSSVTPLYLVYAALASAMSAKTTVAEPLRSVTFFSVPSAANRSCRRQHRGQGRGEGRGTYLDVAGGHGLGEVVDDKDGIGRRGSRLADALLHPGRIDARPQILLLALLERLHLLGCLQRAAQVALDERDDRLAHSNGARTAGKLVVMPHRVVGGTLRCVMGGQLMRG
jgi:hypothetical protein